MADLFENLDPDQAQAVRAIRGPVCIIAGAGTGKTRTITHRIAYAIQSGVTDPSKVLALTFTSKAAQEMRARLNALGIPRVNARTFHSAAMRQLMYFWPTVVGSPFPQLLPNKSAALAEAIKLANLPFYPNAATIRDLAGEIEWAKVQELEPGEYVEKAILNNRLYGDKSKIQNFSKAYHQYESMKSESGVIDFDDLLVLTVGMIEEERSVRERIRDQYRYFTVDEYQDVSPLQQKLLNLWLGNRNEICVVGDAAQTIYSFSGATNNFLLSFGARYPEANIFRLNRGYRSTPEIIRVATQILDSGSTQYGHELISKLDSGIKPTLTSNLSHEQEAESVARQISEYIDQGVHPTEIAVLARTNYQLEIIDKKLVSQGVETDGATTIAARDGEKFFERNDVREAIRDIRVASVLSEEGSDWVSELRGLLQPYSSARFHKSFLYLASQIVESEKEDGDRNPRSSLRTFLREIEDRASQNNPPTYPGIHLGTIHSAKGLEWPIVFLVGVGDQFFPYQNPWLTTPLTETSTFAEAADLIESSLSNVEPNARIEEERRLLYVGITRAQKLAHLSFVGNPSPFVAAWNKNN